MITERLFSRSYGSFWKDLLPFSLAFVRGVNSQWGVPEPPTGESPEPLARAVINEAAVRLYRLSLEGHELNVSMAGIAQREAAAWLGCEGIDTGPVGTLEIIQMAEVILRRFGRSEIVFAPEFRGCGILSACRADFLSANALVEVKSGRRTFRSPDFRQILIYLALNDIDRRYDLRWMSLYNARLGREVMISIDDLCIQLAGSSANEVLSRIADFMTTGIASGL